MYALSKNKTTTWPVVVTLPDEDGKLEDIKFKATFKRLDDDEIEALNKELEEIPTRQQAPLRWSRWLTSWTLKDHAGNAIPCNHDALTSLISSPDGWALVNGLGNALHEMRSGARIKNL